MTPNAPDLQSIERAAALLRQVFGAAIPRGDAPVELLRDEVTRLADVRYGRHPLDLLDIHTPRRPPLPGTPLVVWIHGGAWVSGSKDELATYLSALAGHGFVTVGVDYPLAPESVHPELARHVLAALAHLRTRRDGTLDSPTFVIAGDSAGAQIAAQVALVTTDESYAGRVGLESTIRPEELAGVVLCSGVLDLELEAGTPEGRALTAAVRTVYAGADHEGRPPFELASVLRHVGPHFPPTFIAAGNGDPLHVQARVLAARLEELGVPVDALVLPDDHSPPAGHEYQFDLGTLAARETFRRLVVFLRGVSVRR